MEHIVELDQDGDLYTELEHIVVNVFNAINGEDPVFIMSALTQVLVTVSMDMSIKTGVDLEDIQKAINKQLKDAFGNALIFLANDSKIKH